MILRRSVILDRWNRYDRFRDIGVVVSGLSTIVTIFAEWFVQFSHPNVLYVAVFAATTVCTGFCTNRFLFPSWNQSEDGNWRKSLAYATGWLLITGVPAIFFATVYQSMMWLILTPYILLAISLGTVVYCTKDIPVPLLPED